MMTRREFGRLCLGAGALLVAARPGRAENDVIVTGFLNKTVTIDGQAYPYVVYVPRDYRPDRKWPVILFLHGAGERGSDGLKQSEVGLGRAIRLRPERFPALAVMPQCPAEQWWTRELPVQIALRSLDQTLAEYAGDESRQYLTGLSMGGFGSFHLASLHPNRFAAVVPICGGGNPEEMAPRLKDLPLWVFHGGADEVVPASRSREMVEAIKAAGGTRVRYTEYPDVGHNSWDPAYAEEELARWLFEQRRP